MGRKTYTNEERSDALALCAEIGFPKASEELKISLNTLYSWRNKADQPQVESKAIEAPVKDAQSPVLSVDDEPQRNTVIESGSELYRLEIENKALRDDVARLKKALRVFTE